MKKKHLQNRTETEIIAHHMDNLISTYGEQKVRAAVADMLVRRAAKRAKAAVASNE